MPIDPHLIASMQASGDLPDDYAKVDPRLLASMLDSGDLAIAPGKGGAMTLTPGAKAPWSAEMGAPPSTWKPNMGPGPNAEAGGDRGGDTGGGVHYDPLGDLGDAIKSGTKSAGDWLSTADLGANGGLTGGQFRPDDGSSHDLGPRIVQRNERAAAVGVGNAVKGAGNLAVGIPETVGHGVAEYGDALSTGIKVLAAGPNASQEDLAGAVDKFQHLRSDADSAVFGLVGGPNGAPAKTFRALTYLKGGDPKLANDTMQNVINHLGIDTFNDPATAIMNATVLHGLGVAGIGYLGAKMEGVEGGLRAAAKAAIKAGDTTAADAATAKADELAHTRGLMSDARAKIARGHELLGMPKGPDVTTPIAEAVPSEPAARVPPTLAEPTATETPSAPITPPVDPRLQEDFPTADLRVDPDRFQYKILSGKGGQTGSLSGVKAWDPDFAGILHVWRDPANDNAYVVNGHNRKALADRLGVEKMDVRFIDAPTAEGARTRGALINIAEGQGTVLDAAKMFRDSNMTAEEAQASGLNLAGQKARQGMAISNLATPLFNAALREEISPERAAIIGEKLPRVADQLELAKEIETETKAGRTLTNDEISEMADQMASGPSVTETTMGLFGEETSTRSTFLGRAKVAAYVNRALSKEGGVFNVAAKNADRLAKGGNTIDAVESARIALLNQHGKEIFNRYKNVPGPISDILNEAAAHAANGKENLNGIKQEALAKLQDALPDIVHHATSGTYGPDGRAASEDRGAMPYGAGGGEPVQGEGNLGDLGNPGFDFATQAPDLRDQDAAYGKQSSRVPVAPLPGGTSKLLSNIVLDLGKGVSRKVAVNKLPRGVAGNYRPSTAATTIRFSGDLDVTAHEIAHALSDKHGIGTSVPNWTDENAATHLDDELEPFWRAGGSATEASPLPYKREEGLAEWLRGYVVNPDEAVRRAPNVAQHVISSLSPHDLVAMEQFGHEVRQFAGLAPSDKIASNISVDSRPGPIDKIKQEIHGQGWEFETTGMDRFAAKWMDSLHPYTKAIDAAREIGGVGHLLPEDDPLLLARVHAGIGGKTDAVFEHGMINAHNETITPGGLPWLLEPFDRSTPSTIARDMLDASKYMIAERTIERADLTREEAEQKIRTDQAKLQMVADARITDMAVGHSDRAELAKVAVEREEAARLKATITERQAAVKAEASAAARLDVAKARGAANTARTRLKALNDEMDKAVATARREATLRAEKVTAVTRVRAEGDVKGRAQVAEAIQRERARVEKQSRSTPRGKRNVEKRRQGAADRNVTKIVTPELFDITRHERLQTQRGDLAAENAEARVRAEYEPRVTTLEARAAALEARAKGGTATDITAALADVEHEATARSAAEVQRRHDAITRRLYTRVQREADKIQAHYDQRGYDAATRARARAEYKVTRIAGIGGGISSDEVVAHRTVAEFSHDPKRLAMAQDAARRYRVWADALLRYQVDKGILSEDAYEYIRDHNQYYTAMQREMDNITPPGRGTGGSRLGSGKQLIHKFEGSQRQIKDPYQSLVDKTFETINEADRNEALVAFRDLLTGNRQMGQGPVQNFASIGRLARDGDVNTIKIKVRHVDPKTQVESIRTEHWQFEEGVYKALKGFTSEPIMLPAWARVVPGIMRESVTHFPAFLARNVVRDALDRAIKTEVGSSFRDFARTAPAELRDFRLAGGDQAGHYLQSRENYNRTLSAATRDLATKPGNIMARPANYLRRYQNLAKSSELVNRMAEYRAGYRHATNVLGYDPYNAQLFAASKARGLMDFAVAGEYGRIINQLIPFTNATLQGTASLFRAARRNPGLFAARWGMHILAPTIAVYLWNRAQGGSTLAEYQQMPAYQRDLFWNFKVGPDAWVRIPKGYEVATMAAGVERALDMALGNKLAFDGYAGSLARSFLPIDESAIAGPLKTFLETMVNYSFFKGKSIVPPDEDKKRLELRRGATNSSSFGQALGHVLNADPRKVDYTMGNQLGGFGQLLGTRSLTDALMTTSGFMTHSPGINARDVQGTMNAAAGAGQSDPLKGSQLRLYAAMANGSPQAIDTASRQLREQGTRLRPVYESLSDRLARNARNRR